MPVLPPTAASTADSRVVGMFMNRIPRLNVAAAKPPRSVTIPPPKLTMTEPRVAPPPVRVVHTSSSERMFLLLSPAPMVMIFASAAARLSFRSGRQHLALFSSVSMKSEPGCRFSSAARASSRAFAGSEVKIRACFIGSVVIAGGCYKSIDKQRQRVGQIVHRGEHYVGPRFLELFRRDRARGDPDREGA